MAYKAQRSLDTQRAAARLAMDHLRPRALARALVACSMLSLLVGTVRAQVLPSGATVVNGQVRIGTTGHKMTVTNSNGAIIDWRSFSIGAGAAVRFDQPDAASRVLNRVTGNDPSSILGSLSSNGSVWLLNPNGVLFGAGARVDVAGMVASTLSLSNRDWLAGRALFSADATHPAAAVVNQGELRTPLGGRVALLGGTVRNEGLIDAPNGQVVLAAGQTVELVDTGAPNVALRVTAPGGQALNLGSISADGGSVDIQAAVVNQDGIVRADRFATDASGRPVLSSGTGGRISLVASESLTLAAGSRTQADGGGGRVTLDAGAGTAWVRGAVSVNAGDTAGGIGAGPASGVGGEVQVLGRQVGLDDTARIDASGVAGGGRVFLGGDESGRLGTLPRADALYVAAGAQVRADAGDTGDGGRVIAWGTHSSRVHGSLSARGGARGGDGGFIETSGGWLDTLGARIDATAARGAAGTWLLDPYNITITDNADTAPLTPTSPGAFTSGSASTLIASSQINSALNQGTSVTVTTGAGGTEPGDIFVTNANLNTTASTPVSLTLNAARNINISQSVIGGATQPLSIALNAAGNGAGGVDVTNSQLRSASGQITATGVADRGSVFNGISLRDSVVDAGTGKVTLVGSSSSTSGATATTAFGYGVAIMNSTVNAREVSITGAANVAGSGGAGIGIFGTSKLSAQTSLQLVGAGTTTGLGVYDSSALSVRSSAPSAPGVLSLVGQAEVGAGVAINGTGVTVKGEQGASISMSGVSNAPQDFPGISNSLGTVTTDGGAVTMVATGVDVRSDFRLNSGGRVQLFTDRFEAKPTTAPSLTSQATGDAIVISGLTAPGVGIHYIEANTLSAPNGRWLLFLAQPNNLLRIRPDYKQYGVSYTPTGLASLRPGNGVLFSVQPVLSLSSTQALQKTYDGTTSLIGVDPAQITVTGLLGGDEVNATGTLRGSFADKNVGTNIPITLATDGVSFVDVNGVPVFGYGLNAGLKGNITPAALTITAGNVSKTYGTTASFTGTEFQASGLATGDQIERISLISVGAAAGAGVVAGAYAIVGSAAVGTAFNPANYTITYVNGMLTVTPASLTVTALNQTKSYGSLSNLGTSGFSTTGLVNGDTATQVTLSSSGAAANANVQPGGHAIVASNLSGGNFNPANYTIRYVNGTLTVAPVALTITALNQTKSYGSSLVLNGTEFSVAGLVNGDTVSRVNLTSTGLTATAGVQAGGHAIVASNPTGAGFNPANYSASFVNGTLTVTPVTLTAQIVGTPTKAADGSTAAVLTPANFALSGFFNGDTATVTQGSGRYDSPEAGPRVVLATLARADFAAGGNTSLGNYVLPTAATGAGLITPPPVLAVDQAVSVPLATAVQSIAIAKIASSPTEGRTLDAVPAMGVSATGEASNGFQSIALASLSQEALATMLASREVLKKNLFSTSLNRLAEDPKLADVPDCADIKQLERGNCLITEAVKAQLAAARLAEQQASAPEPNLPAAPSPAPAARTGPAPAAAAPAVAAARPAPPPRGASKRRVVKSALPQIARKIALVIGVDTYADPKIPRLENAGRDARTVGQVLEAALGYEVTLVENGSKEDILGAMNRLAAEADPNDSVVIYYAGHGAVVESTGLGYWQPSNADSAKPESWISNADIHKLIGRMGASQVALISDSCFSGSLITGSRIRASGELVDPSKVLSQKSVVIMTSGGNEPVFDAGRDGHSPFAWNLMRNLERVTSWQAGSNVFERVRFAVAKELPQKPQYGAVTDAGHQLGGDYLFEQRELEAPIKLTR